MERNEYIDYLKGLLIFLVVYGHSIQFILYNGQKIFFNDPIFKLIYIFHMPLFMMVSGYVSYYSISKRSLSKILYKRFNQLIIPIITWAIITNIIELNNYEQDWTLWHSVLFFLKSVVIKTIYSFWFLWCVFGSVVFLLFLKKINKENHLFCILAICVSLLFIMPERAPLYYFKFIFPFFCIGYYFSMKGIQKPLTKNSTVNLLVVVLAVVCFFLWKTETYLYVSGMKLTKENLIIIPFRYFSGIVFSFGFIYVTFLLYNWHPSKMISRIGQNSLAIYILQTFFFELYSKIEIFHWKHYQTTSIILVPFGAIFLCIIFHGLSNLINKQPTLSRLLIGKV